MPPEIDTGCDFCGASADLAPFAAVAVARPARLCPVCRGEAEPDTPAHWHCLQGAAWSPDSAVQFAAWHRLGLLDEGWAHELRAQMSLDPEAQAWEAQVWADTPATLGHRDANGTLLAQGDTVTLIKDLPVKGAGFTAKRGTAVRGISLVPDNPAQIEGRVEGQRIVILTEFVRKR